MTSLPTAFAGGRSSPQVKAGSTTRHLGMPRALSRRSKTSPRAAADAVAEMRVVPAECPPAPRIGVEQQLVGVEAVAVCRLVGAVTR